LIAAAGCFCLLAAAGCQSPTVRNVRPSFEMPAVFSAEGLAPMPEKWWQSFGDPQLEAVIEAALTENFTIRSAWDRLTQAEEVAIQSGAARLPSATYRGGVERLGREVSGSRTYATDYFIGLGAGYEVDLWGRIKSTQQAALLDAQAAQDTVSAASMTLSAAIAKTWYQLAEAKQQHTIITRQIETNEKILAVIKVQFRQGQAGAADVFNQEQLVENSAGQLIQADEDIALLQHQLSILTGKVPGLWWSDRSIELVRPGQLPQIDVPAVVIQRRPDVLVAYRSVQAADQRLAAAIANQYPTVSLSAAIETGGSRTRDLFDDWLGNLAANVAGPLFDAGLRKAEVRRTRAVASERLNTYSQTVLEALQETEDAISQEAYQRQYVDSLQRQLELSRNVYERTYQNYLKGQLDYLRVLTAVVTMQRLEQNELTARRVLIERRIDLCRSIAGGWPLERPDTADLLSHSLFDAKE
jgi:NodT family efflux transporter outer membrane factor (OMF) lipoprotein